jgi:preprotein translocase SecE subunit
MFNFIKEALLELEHVVWPTPTETKKYMNYTVGVIVVLGTFLAFLGYGMRESLSFARSQFPHTEKTSTVSGEDFATRAELEQLTKQIEKKKSQSGSTHTGTTSTGLTTPTKK